MENARQFVGKVIHHTWSKHADMRRSTCFDEYVDLDLSHIAEEAIFILTGHRTDFLLSNQIKKVTHSGSFINPLGSADSSVHINHQDFLLRPSPLFQILNH